MNWKIVVENFIESYHHLGTHAATLQKRFPAEGTYLLDLSDAGVLLENPGVDGAPGTWIAAVFPTLLFFASQDDQLPIAAWYEMQVDAIDHFDLRIHLLLPAEFADDLELRKGALEFLNAIHQEDIQTCDRVQRGLASQFYKPTALATQEHGLARFHHYLAQRMACASQ